MTEFLKDPLDRGTKVFHGAITLLVLVVWVLLISSPRGYEGDADLFRMLVMWGGIVLATVSLAFSWRVLYLRHKFSKELF